MWYPEELTEEVRARNDIVDVIGGYVQLQRKGSYHMGLCPFHNEKTPSFSVSPSRQMFHCFGCGVSGNVFTFLMKYDSLTFQEAVQVLAERAGVALPKQEEGRGAKEAQDKRQAMYALNKEAATFYYRALHAEGGKAGYDYFKGRGLTDDVMKRFGLGFADVSGNALIRHLKAKGYADSLLIEAGLARHDEKRGLRSKFWNRVMFPIQDVNGRVIGFGGRVMGDGEPKYLNSPETMIFDKGRNLYGLNLAKQARKGFLILCEGYVDVIAVHQYYGPVAVASLGTAFTPGQATILKRYAQELLLCFDSDTAGVNAALRAIEIVKDTGLKLRVMSLSPYKDPDEFLKAEGKEAFEERIRDAENPFFFEVRIMEGDYRMGDPADKTAFEKKVAEKLCAFETAAERDNYLTAFAARYGVDAEQMRALVTQHAAAVGLAAGKTVVRAPSYGTAGRTITSPPDEAKSQRMLLSWLAADTALFSSIRPHLTPEDFTDPLCQALASEVFARLSEEGTELKVADLLLHYPEEEEQERAAAVFHTKPPDVRDIAEKERALKDLIYDIRKTSIEREPDTEPDAESVRKRLEDRRALEEFKQKFRLEKGV